MTHPLPLPRRDRARAFPRWLRWLGAALVIVLVASGVAGYLHVHSGFPGNARRDVNGDTDAVNPTIEKKAHSLVAALSAGDTNKVKDLSRQSSAEVQPFVEAFGGRRDVLTNLTVNPEGALFALATISVPCKSGSDQTVMVSFYWDRTSWISSSWFANIHPPGQGETPEGCPKP